MYFYGIGFQENIRKFTIRRNVCINNVASVLNQ